MFSYTLLPKAQTEYEDSVNWYISKSKQTAERFVNAVQNTIGTICNNPFQFRNEYKKFYELAVKKFPFSIVYIIESKSKNIVIISVFHHKRNPAKKYT